MLTEEREFSGEADSDASLDAVGADADGRSDDDAHREAESESESRADDETVPDLDGEGDGRDDAESVVVIVAAALEDTVEMLDVSAVVDRAALGLAAADALAFDEIVQSLNLLREAAAVGVASALTENRADCESLAVAVCIDVTLVETEGGAVVKALAVAAADGDKDGDPL